MPWSGSGVYQRVRNWVNDASSGVKIRADYHDVEDDAFAAGITNCIARDGQSTILQNIPFNSKRITNLGDPVNPQDAVTQKWVGDNVIGGALIADAPPAGGKVGNLWWDSDQGGLYLRYDDGSSVQWVQCNVAPPIAPAAPKAMTAIHCPGNTATFDVSFPPDAEWDVIDISVVSIISSAANCIPYAQPLVSGTPLTSANIIGSTSISSSGVASSQWSGSIFLVTNMPVGWSASGLLTLQKTGTPMLVAWCGGTPVAATLYGGGYLLPTGPITGMRIGVNAGTMTEGWARVVWR